MKETYKIEDNTLILIDTEIGVSFKEPFISLTIPAERKKGQKVSQEHLLRSGTSPEELYLEKSGKRDGQCLLLYPEGSVKMETFYSEGLLHGPSTYFSEKGKLLSKGWFVQGHQQGKCWWYYPSGQLYSLQRYRDGVWHGKQEFYYPDGRPKTIMNYEQGALN